MHILIIGAAGMIGRKLTARLIADGALRGQTISKLTLADIVEPPSPTGFSGSVDIKACDLSVGNAARDLISKRPDVVFHLAAIVSGEAEADFEKGYRINLGGTTALLDAIIAAGKEEPYYPKVVFTSSIAVFGVPLPDPIPDTHHLTPLTSYGTQKAIGELLLNDYSRKGLMDGISLRLPTICVRPGKPNAAASGFFSGIIREPLNGQDAILPVSDNVRHWHASPRAAVGFLLHAAELDTAEIGPNRAFSLPGLSVTVAEQIEALRNVAGNDAVSRIKRVPDQTIIEIVGNWPQNFEPKRALAAGFKAEKAFEDIIHVYLEDDFQK